MAAKQRNPEMEALMNSAREETLSSGRKVKIFAVPWMHAAKFAAAAEPVFKLFLGDEPPAPAEPARPVPHPDIPVEAAATVADTPEPAPVAPAAMLRTDELLTRLMKHHMGDMMALCECCTDMSEESLGYLQMDDAMLVAGAVINVNMTFFRQRLQGRLPALLAGLLGGNMESGSTALPDSSPTGTTSAA